MHRVLVDIVSAAAGATPGLGRYPPFKREVFFKLHAACLIIVKHLLLLFVLHVNLY